MNYIIKILFLFSGLVAYSSTSNSQYQKIDEKTIYFNSEQELNEKYLDIKNYIRDNQVELKYLVDTQRAWLKNRNVKCRFDGKNPNSENYKCLSDSNYAKVKDLKKSYLNFESLENSVIRPFKYTGGIQKNLEIGGCWCGESMIKILNDKIYVYQVCDDKLKTPRIYKIVGKRISEFSAEYQIDTNNNGVSEFNLSFVTSGKNVWNLVPTVFRKDDLINLNFSINYTTDTDIKVEKLDCSDSEE